MNTTSQASSLIEGTGAWHHARALAHLKSAVTHLNRAQNDVQNVQSHEAKAYSTIIKARNHVEEGARQTDNNLEEDRSLRIAFDIAHSSLQFVTQGQVHESLRRHVDDALQGLNA